jgi:hypothetical protein
VNSLIAAGLRIDTVREYSKLSWKMYPFMELDPAGWWRLPARFPELPLMFSLRATRM